MSDSSALRANASVAATDAWSTSPLPPHLREAAAQLVSKLDERQRLWLSGYLAGIGAASAGALPAAAYLAAGSQAGPPAVTVLYGTQGGNAEGLARRACEALKARGVHAVVQDMLACTKADLVSAQSLLVVVSTYGEGDPPDSALPLWELLESRKAPPLAGKTFSVLALGDSSYQKFCETGRRFDAKLEALGASRLHDRVDCDVDFETAASAWIDAVAGKVSAAAGAAANAAGPAAIASTPTASVSSAYTRRNPFAAELLANQRLTSRGSSKDVRHLELSLSGSNIRYEPGDSIGIVPSNPPERVDALLEALKLDPDTSIAVDSKNLSFRDFLIERADIGLVDSHLINNYAAAIGSASLAATTTDPQARARSWLDLVREHPPTGVDCATFAALLRPLAPRLYSIASSLAATPDEAHLTVSVTEFETSAGKQLGLVSGRLAATVEGATLPVYLQRNASFRLPESDRPIIMIGPGTGVAPFRAFMAEREAVGARGRNWLFFGERCFEHDFLYQVEWLGWRKSGLLTRLDVAFSRDQARKIYVQHRLRERGAEVWSWLQDGAYLYVCGDASSMAPDVHAALLEIIAKHGGHGPEAAAEYLQQLQRNRRYQRDVY